MPSSNTTKQIVFDLTEAVKIQIDRLTRSQETARALMRDFQEVATAVFVANNIPATFVAWSPDDEISRKCNDMMPAKCDGIRFARLDVGTPFPDRFARFVFFGDTADSSSNLTTSLQCIRFIGDGFHVEAIGQKSFTGTTKRILFACANASRGNGLPSPI